MLSGTCSVPLRWGILGAGTISHDFAAALQLSKNHKVLSIAARDLKKAQDFATNDDHNIPNAYGNYENLAKDTNVDVVYIGNTQPYHLQVAKLMLNNGKAVLCEKPLTMNLKQTEELVSLARQKNLFLMEGFWSRFFPAYSRLREEISKGTVGDIIHVSATITGNVKWKPRMSNKEDGGGCILNFGSYAIQFVLWVFDEQPVEVMAHGVINETGAEEGCTISMKFSRGRTADIYCDSRFDGKDLAQVYGTKGTLEILPTCIRPLKLVTPTETLNFPVPETTAKLNFESTTAFVYQADAVRESILEGKKECPIMSLQDSLNVASIVDNVRGQLGVDVEVK